MDAQKKYEEAVQRICSLAMTIAGDPELDMIATIRAAQVVVVPEKTTLHDDASPGEMRAYMLGFVAGLSSPLTAEREKARKLGEALEELTAVAESHLSHHCSRCSAATKNARATLAAWKESR